MHKAIPARNLSINEAGLNQTRDGRGVCIEGKAAQHTAESHSREEAGSFPLRLHLFHHWPLSIILSQAAKSTNAVVSGHSAGHLELLREENKHRVTERKAVQEGDGSSNPKYRMCRRGERERVLSGRGTV